MSITTHHIFARANSLAILGGYVMSEAKIALMVTVAILLLMFVWVPILNFVCPPCGRAIERLREKKKKDSHDETSLRDLKKWHV
jgi:hypothetical protein